MKISEVVESLEKLKAKLGDADVFVWSHTEPGKTRQVDSFSTMHRVGNDKAYVVAQCNPNLPSGTENESGLHRGNNPHS